MLTYVLVSNDVDRFPRCALRGVKREVPVHLFGRFSAILSDRNRSIMRPEGEWSRSAFRRWRVECPPKDPILPSPQPIGRPHRRTRPIFIQVSFLTMVPPMVLENRSEVSKKRECKTLPIMLHNNGRNPLIHFREIHLQMQYFSGATTTHSYEVLMCVGTSAFDINMKYLLLSFCWTERFVYNGITSPTCSEVHFDLGLRAKYFSKWFKTRFFSRYFPTYSNTAAMKLLLC